MNVGVFCRDPLLKDGLACLLSNLAGGHTIVSASNLSEIREIVDKPLDILVAAMDQIDSREIGAIESAKRRMKMSVVAIVSSDSVSANVCSVSDHMVNRGAGFDGLRKALMAVDLLTRPVASGSVREYANHYGLSRSLTPREREVARLVSRGMPNRGIAKVLGIQEQSVKNLVSGVMRKLACENRTQLALHLSSSTY